MYNRVFI